MLRWRGEGCGEEGGGGRIMGRDGYRMRGCRRGLDPPLGVRLGVQVLHDVCGAGLSQTPGDFNALTL